MNKEVKKLVTNILFVASMVQQINIDSECMDDGDGGSHMFMEIRAQISPFNHQRWFELRELEDRRGYYIGDVERTGRFELVIKDHIKGTNKIITAETVYFLELYNDEASEPLQVWPYTTEQCPNA